MPQVQGVEVIVIWILLVAVVMGVVRVEGFIAGVNKRLWELERVQGVRPTSPGASRDDRRE